MPLTAGVVSAEVMSTRSEVSISSNETVSARVQVLGSAASAASASAAMSATSPVMVGASLVPVMLMVTVSVLESGMHVELSVALSP